MSNAQHSFNSIKVRLKHCLPLVLVFLVLPFNSIKVRLKLDAVVDLPLSVDFQFHKGAIETMRANTNLVRVQTFQFHKGAIETVSAVGNLFGGFFFQFHKGAIETSTEDADTEPR